MGEAFALKFGLLKERFRGRMIGDVDKLDHLALQLAATDSNSEERKRIRDIAHRLAGTAGTFGYPDLTERAAHVEKMADVACGNSALAETARLLSRGIREVMDF